MDRVIIVIMVNIYSVGFALIVLTLVLHVPIQLTAQVAPLTSVSTLLMVNACLALKIVTIAMVIILANASVCLDLRTLQQIIVIFALPIALYVVMLLIAGCATLVMV